MDRKAYKVLFFIKMMKLSKMWGSLTTRLPSNGRCKPEQMGGTSALQGGEEVSWVGKD